MAPETIVELGPQSMTGSTRNGKEVSSATETEEKGQIVEADGGMQSYRHAHLDSERAVVRKLDWRIPTLLAVLCWFVPFYPLL